jgi:hypothetical protein
MKFFTCCTSMKTMAKLFAFPRAAAVHGQRPPSPTPTKEADEGRAMGVAREETAEIEPREEN